MVINLGGPPVFKLQKNGQWWLINLEGLINPDLTLLRMVLKYRLLNPIKVMFLGPGTLVNTVRTASYMDGRCPNAEIWDWPGWDEGGKIARAT